MARRICQGLLAIALLYVAAVIGFQRLHYEKGASPDLVTAAKDMHRAIAALFARAPEPVPEPGTLPPPRAAEPPSEAEAPPPPPPPAPARDARAETLVRVNVHLLPEAERLVRAIPKESPKSLDDRKAEARVALVAARDALNPLLDADRHDKEAQALYQRVMELLIAVDKR